MFVTSTDYSGTFPTKARVTSSDVFADIDKTIWELLQVYIGLVQCGVVRAQEQRASKTALLRSAHRASYNPVYTVYSILSTTHQVTSFVRISPLTQQNKIRLCVAWCVALCTYLFLNKFGVKHLSTLEMFIHFIQHRTWSSRGSWGRPLWDIIH